MSPNLAVLLQLSKLAHWKRGGIEVHRPGILYGLLPMVFYRETLDRCAAALPLVTVISVNVFSQRNPKNPTHSIRHSSPTP